MGAFDKVLEFFGLKSDSVQVQPSDGPGPDADTNRGQLQSAPPAYPPTFSQGPPASTDPASVPSGASTPAQRPLAGSMPLPDPALEQERRARVRAEEELRAARAEQERLMREADLRSASSASGSTASGFGAVPRTDAVTGQDEGARKSPTPAPESDKTLNPNMVRKEKGPVPTGVLVAISGPNVGLVRALSSGKNIIGRHTPGTRLAVPLHDEDKIVSREHCEIECSGDRFTIRPLRTSSDEDAKTILNDHTLEGKQLLQDGATIRVFDNVLRFRTLESGA